MDLDITAIRRTAREELAEPAHAGNPGRVNRPLIDALAECGLLPRLFPRRLGGTSDQEVSATTLCLLREGIATEVPEAETALAMQGLGGYPILQSGSEELAGRWIPAIASGEVVAAFALTEPNAGSDAAAIELVADQDGDGWRLDGEKAWISNAPDADLYTVFARTTADAGARGVTAFAIPGDREGLTGAPVELLAPHAIGHLEFDGVRVEPDEVLGEVDHGFRVAMRTLDLFRPSVGAFAVGMAQAALETAAEWAREREAFGRPIGRFQGVSHQLADMATRTEASRLLVHEAASVYDEGREQEITQRSAMAKLYATESAQFVVDAAVQILGARALQKGHLLERLYREVRAPRIYEGTSEIQRNIIARELLREE
ncbi:MAG: acyl-CoA dehydrogenase family protein [Nitriliruptorales bacterium]|nr:acyl-CoA dehydrogenase family protein [Nitriliruptorales bacterium]